jgi:hypothetical protein
MLTMKEMGKGKFPVLEHGVRRKTCGCFLLRGIIL